MSLDGFSAAALLQELRQVAGGARLQKFSQLTEGDFLLHLRSMGRTDKLLISLHPQRSRFHLVYNVTSGAIVPNSFVMLCRKHIGGTRLEELKQHDLDRIVEFRFSSGFSLVLDWSGRPSGLLLVQAQNDGGTIVGAYPGSGRFRLRTPFVAATHDKPSLLSYTSQEAWTRLAGVDPSLSLETALESLAYDWSPLWKRRFLQQLQAATVTETNRDAFESAFSSMVTVLADPESYRAGLVGGELSYCAPQKQFETMQLAANARWQDSSLAPGLSDFRQELLKRLKKNREKSVRKAQKREQDRLGAASADADQLKADLLLAYALDLDRGQTSFSTKDWEGRPLVITLDPKLNSKQNAEVYYLRAKKKRRALVVLEEQIRLAQEEIEMWDELIFAAETSDDRTDLEQVRRSLPVPQGKKRTKVPEIPSTGPRRYEHHGFEILVGRNPLQNDNLSFKIANKDDHWFHILQGAGSHVILRTKGQEPPPGTLLAAGWLAAKHSRSALSGRAVVITTRARFLKKAKGGPLGKALYRQESEVVVNPTDDPPEGLTESKKNSDR